MDAQRLDLIERLNLQVKQSPDTGLWVVWCARESRVDICPAPTLRQALDDFAHNQWPLKQPISNWHDWVCSEDHEDAYCAACGVERTVDHIEAELAA